MKRILTIAAMSSMALMMTFCTKVDEYENTTNPLPLPDQLAESAAVQGLTITPKNSYVVIGEPVALEVTAQPEGADPGTITWTSSDESVATVDAGGNVTTLAKGIAMITATAGESSVTAIVNVFAERVPATEIQVNKTEINLLVGRATKVKATLLPDGTGEDGAVTTDKQAFEWSSSNENVATVSYGFVQAVGLGEAVVTVKQENLSATVKVTVADKIALQDRSTAWPITATPKWDKNWSGQVTGSHEEVTVTDVDAAYFYYAVVSADKFDGIEAVSNTLYEQVEERKDAGQNPASLFKTGESASINYSDLGQAVAYALGYDEEFEFTGEYSLLEFESVEPDPVHATGIQFTQSWNNTPIDQIVLKEGKSLTYFSAKLLPDDCTDIGSISFQSSDESVVTIKPYYSSYYTVSAVAPGTAEIIATFNDLTASIPVTVTGSDMVWTDCSASWKGHFGMGKLWGYYDVFGFTLEECSSPSHLIVVVKVSDISGDPAAYYKTVASQNESSLGWYASDEIPEFSGSYGDTDESVERYAYVFGVSSGDYDGNYAIFHYDPNGGDDDPDDPDDPTPTEGSVVSLNGQFFPVKWDDEDATQDEVTMEAWFNPSSISGYNDGINTIMGTEGIFLLRFEGSKLQLVYAGDQRTGSKEYSEEKLVCNTTVSTNEWHHVAATYKKGGDVVLYLDGESVASGTAKDHSLPLNGVGAQWGLPFSFYVGVSATNRCFQGNLAEVRVWNEARTASEIKDNMKKSVTNGAYLLACWPMDEGSGNTCYDVFDYYNLRASKSSNGNSHPASAQDTDLTWVAGTRPF